MVDSNTIVFTCFTAIALATSSEWLFFLSIALLAVNFFIKAEEKRGIEERAKKETEKKSKQPKKEKEQLIIIRQTAHHALHEKPLLELAEEIPIKRVLHHPLHSVEKGMP